MSSTYLTKLARIDHLFKSWLHLSDSTRAHSRETSGVDGQSVNQFAARSNEYLDLLRRHLLRPGGYSFSGLKAHLESKDAGGHRVICIPTVKDRVVQRAILDLLADSGKYAYESHISYGFIKGRNVLSAIERAIKLRQSSPWVYKTDVTKFFDTISRRRIADEIRKKIRAPSIQGLIIAATKCEVQARNSSQSKKIRRAGVIRGKGIRQGMPLSPYLSNLFLHDFDKTIESEKRKAVRYADDLIFMANSEQECVEIHELCKRELDKIGLSIQPIGTDKTKILGPKSPVEFLGITIGMHGQKYVPLVSKKKTANMKAELLRLANFTELERENISVSNLMQSLNGKIAGWNSTYEFCANNHEVSEFLETYRIKVIERVFVEGLGVSLTNRTKRFLEIE